MKKLVLLSLAVGMFSVSFADGVKKNERLPLMRDNVPTMRVVNANNAEAQSMLGMGEKSSVSRLPKSSNKATPASRFVNLGEVTRVPFAFGLFAITGPFIDYNPTIGLISTTNFLVDTDPADTEDELQIRSSYSVDGKKFDINEVMLPSDKVSSGTMVRGGIYAPTGASIVSDVYAYAGGTYNNVELEKSEGYFTGYNKYQANPENAVIAKKADEPGKNVYLTENRWQAMAFNYHDNSVWTAIPNFSVTDNLLNYENNFNLLKTTIDASGAPSIELMQVDAPGSLMNSIQMAWSPDGKYGVVAWNSTSTAVDNSINEVSENWNLCPLFLFTSDYGKTWSDLQTINMAGPDGISALTGYYSDEFCDYTQGGFSGTAGDALCIMPDRYSFDVTIDKWGNLYFGCHLDIIFSSDGVQGYYYKGGMYPMAIMYSTAVTEADNTTNIRNITNAVALSPFIEDVPYTDGPKDGPIGALNMGANYYGASQSGFPYSTGSRFQFSTNKVGTKIAAMWMDAVDYSSYIKVKDPVPGVSNEYGIYPALDVFGIAWDLATNKFAMDMQPIVDNGEKYPFPYNFTFGTNQEGKNHFLSTTNITRHTSDDTWEIPCTSVDVAIDAQGIADIDLAPFTYLGGISFMKADFSVNKRNKAPITTPGEVTESLDGTLLVGVNEAIELAPMSLYPNPAVNEINVDVEGEVSIYNVAGQLVKTVQVSNGKVDISNLPAGAMIIKAEGKAPQKFIKK